MDGGIAMGCNFLVVSIDGGVVVYRHPARALGETQGAILIELEGKAPV
jgi:hypothetical protein